MTTIKDVEELTNDIDQIKLNKYLCEFLAQEVTKAKMALMEFKGASSIHVLSIDNQNKIFEVLNMVVKRAKNLMQKCMCKELSWLDAAITLANVKEDVLEIQLDLSWWTSMLEIASTNLDIVQFITKAMRNDEAIFQNAMKVNSFLQKAYLLDIEYLISKLEEVKNCHVDRGKSINDPHDHNYILSTYLLARLQATNHKVGDVDLQLKEFTKVNYMGEGSFGQVHEVTWLKRKCALKILPPIDHGKDDMENTILQKCNHPNVIQFMWYWEDIIKNRHIMMDWMPKDLSTYMRDVQVELDTPPFELHVAIGIMLQIAKAMRYLHKQKIIHGDLKPQNILVQPITNKYDNFEGYLHVKIADFGSSIFETSLSQIQMKVGTRLYAAPELNFNQQMHGNMNPNFLTKVDVWSFAIICSEILTGKEHFMVPNDLLPKDDLRPDLPKNCPNYLQFCITKCWDHFPENRPSFSNICRMLNLAKAMTLGISPFKNNDQLFCSIDLWNNLENRYPSYPSRNLIDLLRIVM